MVKFILIKSPDEWATTKQACRDELVVYLFFSTIYIHTHSFTKTLLFQKYISYICITVEKRLKQGGHISSVIPLWPLSSVF